MDSFIVQQFEDLFDRGKAGGLHSYRSRSEFIESCLKQFIAKFDEQLNIKIKGPTEVKECKDCGIKYPAHYTACLSCGGVNVV
jgi:hypothetical protein